MIDPWPAGYYGAQDHYDNSPLICRPLTFMRAAPSEHGYARPVEGVIVTVDLDAMKVLEVADHGVVPLPPTAGNYDGEADVPPRTTGRRSRSSARTSNRSRSPSPRDRVSRSRRTVPWQNWSFRLGFTPREGLALHDLGLPRQGTTRPILYRASLHRDGRALRRPGTDAMEQERVRRGRIRHGPVCELAHARLRLPRTHPLLRRPGQQPGGTPLPIKNAICMHEEDYGISWKHTDYRTARRGAPFPAAGRFVGSATVDNYEYGFFWYLYKDGTIEFEVKLTGVLTAGAFTPGEVPRHGQAVAPEPVRAQPPTLLQRPAGPRRGRPGQQRVRGQLRARRGPRRAEQPLVQRLGRGADAAGRPRRRRRARSMPPAHRRATGRSSNPSKVNELGRPVAYKLMPGASPRRR